MRALSALAFVLALSPCTFTLADTIGAWDHGTRDQLFYAVTTNDGGNVFGQFCMATEDNCLYVVGLPTRCEADAAYPVLVNADSGAFNAVLVCRGPIEGRALYRYVFDTFGPIDEAVRESSKIGFAMPVEADQFRSASFSLEGATASLSIMRAAARRAERPARPKSLDGEVL
jgi:hypothetical protein